MSTGTILDRILETKQDEVVRLRGSYRHLSDRIAACADLPPTRNFREKLNSREQKTGRRQEERGTQDSAPNTQYPVPSTPGRRNTGPALIAEVKKASPSKGVIREDFDPVAVARAYFEGGAACLSVLTDETYFQGNLSYLSAIREAVPLPLLRKDFLIDPAQIYEARLAGADAILLIVAAIPSPARLAEMRLVAESVGMDALVEVHDAAELAMAIESGATVIGVNNRDLRTFEVSLATFESLAPLFPEGTVAVAESGIFTHEDVLRMGRAGASAVLVGESLMRQDDIKTATRQLLGTV